MRSIDRYDQTRLSNGEAASYVSLARLKALRSDGYEVVVRDVENGRFVTEDVLGPGLGG